MEERYSRRGVSATKSEVHRAVRHLNKGLFPNAFCKILPDIASGHPDYCNIMHSDTAGTKTSLAYIYWKETGDENVWNGIVQDALIMNIDDLICVGAVDDIIVSSTIGRNRHLISGEVIGQLIGGSAEYISQLNELGIGVTLAGGETADVGDIVRTLDVGYTAFARIKRSDVIEVDLRPGDVIVGLASYGQAIYETEYNSGIGCNGLTSARHDVLTKYLFARYPESYNPAIPQELVYSGSRKLTEIEETTGMSIGKLLLSPTRTYAPLIKKILRTIPAREIHGMIHCSGGGQTKILHFMQDKLRVVKDSLFPLPPLFQIIQSESSTSWQEMYKVFNMGHRMEIYLPDHLASHIIKIAEEYGIDARIVGRCEPAEKRELLIQTDQGEFKYA